MKVIQSALGGVLVFEPVVHGDDRGFFFESYREDLFRRAVGFTWPLTAPPILAPKKDSAGKPLAAADVFEAP